MTRQKFTVAQSFDARIRVSAPDQGLYLVAGRAGSPLALVQQLGGQPVFQIPRSFKLLALLSGAAFLTLRSHAEIELVGPVSIDSARFNRFLQLAGIEHQEVPHNDQDGG
jgi:hypothetical protein